MAVSHRNTQQATGTTTAVVTKPTGCVDGDLLVALVVSVGGATGAPAGWTQLDDLNPSGSRHVTTYYKVASGEGSTFTFTGTTSVKAIVLCFTGTATSSPLDGTAHSAQVNASSTTITAAGVTTATNHDLLVWGAYHASSSTGGIAQPAGFTEPTNGDFVGGSTPTIEVAYLLDQTPAGATGNKTGSGDSSQVNAGFLAAFKLLSGTTILPPVATATAAGQVPVPTVKPLPDQATATGSAPVPTPAVKPLPGAATATGAAFAPGIGPLTIAVPVATASGAAPVPVAKVVVLPATAAATAAGQTPTPTVALLPGAATALAAAAVPTATVTIVVPLATAAGVAPVPTPVTAVLVPVAVATAAAAGTIVVQTTILTPAAATALATALLPLVVAYQNVAMSAILAFAPVVEIGGILGESATVSAIGFDSSLASAVAFDVSLEFP